MTIQDQPTREQGSTTPALLLLEPDKARQDRLADWLAEAGLRCLTAGKLRRGLELLGREPVGLLMASAGLDCLSHAESIDSLRRAGDEGYLAVLAYGPDLDSGQRAKLLDMGVDDAVALEEPTDELLARIRSLLRVKALNDELTRSKLRFRKSVARQQQLVRRVRRQNRRLRGMAFTDPLTSVYNSRYFRQWLGTQFEIARRYKLLMSVLMIDIDHFKRVNDACGHPFGDYVLNAFAELLKNQVRSSDVVARMGGDEFVIGLVETGRQEAVRFGRRLLRAIANHSFEYFGQTESITISVGQAGFPEDVEIATAEQLLLFADQALYLAKANGRNDLACWHELDQSLRKRLSLPGGRPETQTASAEPTVSLPDPQ